MKILFKKILNKKSAFTLLELLVSIGIMGFVVVAASMGTFQIFKSKSSNSGLQAASAVQNAGDWISKDARNAEAVNTTDGTRLIFTWHDYGFTDDAHQTTVTYSVVADADGSHLQRSLQYGTVGVSQIVFPQPIYVSLLSLIDIGTGQSGPLAVETVASAPTNQLRIPRHPVDDNLSFGPPTIWTDKADYMPGETVLVGGSGFQPGESVHLFALGSPNGIIVEGDARIADDGTFEALLQLPPLPDMDDSYLLTARGLNSGLVAQTAFLDATYSCSVSSSSNPSTYGASVTFTAKLTSNQSQTWNGSVQFKIDGSNFGASVNVSNQVGKNVNVNSAATTTITAGNHTVSASFTGTPSNVSASLSGGQTVNKATLTITADNKSRAYGSVNPTWTATITGFVNGQTSSVVSGSPAFTGTATTTNSSSAVGAYVITPTVGTLTAANYTFTFSNGTLTITKANQTITVTTPAPASASNGSTFPVAATTSSGLAASITTDGIICTGSGSASATITIASGGAGQVYFDQPGNSNYNSATQIIENVSVVTKPSAVSLASSINPSSFGQPVIFTATATGSGGTPTGSVTFKDGGASLGARTLDGSGVAIYSTSTLSGGSHTITAVYAGDASFSGSTSSSLTQIINPINSSTAVTSSANPSSYAQSVTFTTTVTASTGTPTGTVTFKNGAATLGTGTLNGSGQTTYSTSGLTLGGHSITAVYSGDANFNASTSSVLSQSINSASSTSVATSLSPSSYGQSVTFTATVTGSGGTPTGAVTFKDGAATLGTGTLNGSGQAAFTTTALSGGIHIITAVYGGDGNFSVSASGNLTQNVNSLNSSTTLSSSVNPSVFGQSITFTASVSGSGGIPTGVVTFKDSSVSLGSGNLDGTGQTTFVASGLTTGSHIISAVYVGDSNFNGSSSANLTQAVNKSGTVVTVSSSVNPSSSNQLVSFTATPLAVGPGSGVPTGTVTFKNGSVTLGTATLNGSGFAVYSTSALTSGSHSITVVYGGDSNFNNSTSSPLNQIVSSSPGSTPTSGQSYIADNTVISNASYNNGELTFTITTTIGVGPNQVVLPKTYKVQLRNNGN